LVLCYSWFPTQNGLQLAGVLLILGGHLMVWTWDTRSEPAPFAFMGIGLGLILIFMPMTLSTGMMWRNVSALRTIALLPRSRLKLLLGVMGATLAFAIFVAGNIALFDLEAPTMLLFHGRLVPLFVGVLAMETAAVLFFFLLSGTTLAIV